MTSGRINFRIRPIDLNVRLDIFRTEKELREVEEHERARTRGRDEEFEEPDRKKEVHIPLPAPNFDEAYDKALGSLKGLFHRTQTYIRTPDKGGPGGDDEKCIEYDIESDDEAVLEVINADRKKLSEEKIEEILDKLEKEQGKLDRDAPPPKEKEPSTTEKGKEKEKEKDKKDKEPEIVQPEMMSLTHAQSLFSTRPGPEVVAQVYNHWVAKRLTDFRGDKRGPLLRQFRVPPSPHDPSPNVCFRPREKEKARKNRRNDAGALNKMRELRRHMERVRDMLELVKKREKLKREAVCVMRDLFHSLRDDFVEKPKDKKQAKLRRKHEGEGEWEDGHARKRHKFRNKFEEPGPKVRRDDGGESDSSSSAHSDDELPLMDIDDEMQFDDLAPLRVRSRARVGRGGRIVFDRVLVKERTAGFRRHSIAGGSLCPIPQKPERLTFAELCDLTLPLLKDAIPPTRITPFGMNGVKEEPSETPNDPSDSHLSR